MIGDPWLQQESSLEQDQNLNTPHSKEYQSDLAREGMKHHLQSPYSHPPTFQAKYDHFHWSPAERYMSVLSEYSSTPL